MGFQKRRRAIVAAFAIVVTALLTSSSQADYWEGKRTNGKPCNGYWIDPSTSSMYGTQMRGAIDSWKDISTNVTPELRFRTGTYLSPNDKVIVLSESETPSDAIISDPKAITQPYEGVRGDVYRSSNLDRNWFYCVLVVFEGKITRFDDGEIDPTELRRTFAHEIGHSLKLDHTGEGVRRFGVVDWNAPPSTLMYEIKPTVPSFAPTDYDRNELTQKWRTQLIQTQLLSSHFLLYCWFPRRHTVQMLPRSHLKVMGRKRKPKNLF
ncbi:MAG: hypothetical protein H7Y38_06915 [Armatimonadetes bacterium]|nr:hypothetical protein [Armatimonadota bacterium]